MIARAINTITVEDAKAHLEDIVLRVSHGETWLIINSVGQPIAELTPLERGATATGERWEAFGMMKGQIVLKPGFDEPLEDFKPYTE